MKFALAIALSLCGCDVVDRLAGDPPQPSSDRVEAPFKGCLSLPAEPPAVRSPEAQEADRVTVRRLYADCAVRARANYEYSERR